MACIDHTRPGSRDTATGQPVPRESVAEDNHAATGQLGAEQETPAVVAMGQSGHSNIMTGLSAAIHRQYLISCIYYKASREMHEIDDKVFWKWSDTECKHILSYASGDEVQVDDYVVSTKKDRRCVYERPRRPTDWPAEASGQVIWIPGRPQNAVRGQDKALLGASKMVHVKWHATDDNAHKAWHPYGSKLRKLYARFADEIWP